MAPDIEQITDAWKRFVEENLKLKDSPLLNDLDRIFAITGVIVSLILILFLTAYPGREFSRVVYLLTGILVLISCLLWLAIRKSHTLRGHLSGSQTLTAFWSICFFGLFTLSILSIHFRPELYERPILYFVLTSLMSGVIACEVFTSGKRHVPLILIQVVLLGVSIAWSQLLIFPSLLGVDPWYHYDLTNRIIEGGFIPKGDSYSSLQIFHLVIAATSLITGLPYKFSAMVSVSLGQIICNAAFVFLIAGNLFRNYRVGLLAALMVIIANYHINMSYWSIPNGFAAVFIPIALYLLFFKFEDRSHSSSAILFIVVSVTIILTHTLAAICMAIILFVNWGALIVYRAYRHSRADYRASLIRPVAFMVTMFAWWAYASDGIVSLASFIEWGFRIDFFGGNLKELEKFLDYELLAIPLGERLFNDLVMYMFFAFSLIGIFYMISQRGGGSSFAMAWVGMLPLAISFFSVISKHDMMIQRWWYFAQILQSIPLSAAIYILGTGKLKRPFHLYSFVFCFVVAFSFLMILTPPANVDNHLFSPVSGYTYAYTQSEMVASDFFAANTIGTISSDFNYCTNPSSSVFVHEYGIDPGRLLSLDLSLVSGKFDHDSSVKILRSRRLKEPVIMWGLKLPIARPDLSDYVSNCGFSRIYDNPAVSGYIG